MESMERKVGDATLYPLGDRAVVIRFGEHLSEETHRKVRLFDALLNERPFPGMVETVPSFAAVAVFYDLVQVAGAMESRYGGADRKKSGKDGMGGQGRQGEQVSINEGVYTERGKPKRHRLIGPRRLSASFAMFWRICWER